MWAMVLSFSPWFSGCVRGQLTFRAVATAVLAGLTLLLAPALAGAASPSTTVVLTFDDGLADQYTNALPALTSHNMNGTFYVNSAHIANSSLYMTWPQLQAIASAGNEVGGHTVDHPDLTLLTPSEAAREVCNDRVNLINQGFQPTDFAFPFGASNATVQSIVQNCGYDSARTIGGIVSPSDGACSSGCPFAETIPPKNPYFIRTPDSIVSTNTVSDLETLVTQAQSNGGGLVPIVFHHICDNACDPRSITPANFNSFLDWLQQQVASGAVAVKTMQQVVGGSFQPGVPGPPPTGTSLQNPSLEADASGDSVPDCWQAGGYGTNTPSFTRTSNAHTGSWAEQLSVSGFSSGAASLVVTQDQGQCSPAVTPGRAYTVSSWYESTTSMSLVAYYRDQIGAWHTLGGSPSFPVESGWTDAVWTTPAMPSNATGISFGPTLSSNGSITIDDLGLTVAAPTVSLTGLTSGQVYSGVQTLTATAGAGTDHVDFLVNGNVVGTATAAPYSVSWNSTSVPDGPVLITARAVDPSGDSSSSSANVSIDNSGSAVKNSSLEWISNGGTIPDCWQASGFGTNTYAWTHTTDAHSGSYAENVNITSYTSGGRYLLITQDGGSCGPAVTPGTVYGLSEWFKSNAPVWFVAYTRNSAGTWSLLKGSPNFTGSATTWTQAKYTLPAIPSGANAISFGMELGSAGSLTVDDASLLCGSSACDTTPPSSFATAPQYSSSGSWPVSFTATDSQGGGGIKEVDLYAKAPGQTSYTKVASNTTGSSSGSFTYTASAGDGPYSFYTLSSDNAGNSETAPNNPQATTLLDTTAPTSTATAPTYTTTATWTVTYSAADSSGGSGLASVELWAKPPGASSYAKVATNTSGNGAGSFSYTGGTGEGKYAFYTIAVDRAGNRQAAPSSANTSTILDTIPPSAFQMTDPGQYLRGTVKLSPTNTPTDGGSGMASVAYQYRASGSVGNWLVACTAAASPWSCSWKTTGASDGQYDLRAVASDRAGNTTVASNTPLTGRTVDNTSPSAKSISTTNVSGGTKGVAETGDSVTFAYSETIKPSSILASWSGASTAVQVQIAYARSGSSLTVWSSSGSTELPLANPLALGGNYVPSGGAVFAATMVQNGASITVTLGSLSRGAVNKTVVAGGTMTWTPSSSATDLAGNKCSTKSAAAPGPAF